MAFNLPVSIPQFISTHKKNAPARFFGAYDAIPSIAAAYGMRRLRTAYTGSLLRVRRSSDNTESDIGYTADGHLDTAAVAAFVGGGSGYIVTWYDQSGNGYDATQTTAANQPLYVASGQNSRPVGRWDGSNDSFVSALSAAISESTIFAVAKITNFSIARTIVGSSIAGGLQFRVDTSQFMRLIKQGVADIGVGDLAIGANYVVVGAIYNSVSGAFAYYKNGGAAGSGTNAQTLVASTRVIGKDATSEIFIGDIAELIICNAALSDANRQAAEATANAYWAVY